MNHDKTNILFSAPSTMLCWQIILVAIWIMITALPAAAQQNDDPMRVIINEIFYNPTGQEEGNEFIELYNPTDDPIDLSGWQFTNGVQLQILPATIIGPNDYWVAARNADDFIAAFGFVPDAVFQGALANGGETIILRSTKGQLVDQITYDDTLPWPTSPDGAGDSLQLISPDIDNDKPTSWMANAPTARAVNRPKLTLSFSHERGFYTGDFTVYITPTIPTATVMYATDAGALDTPYTGPIAIAGNGQLQVIRAEAQLGNQTSGIVNHTYVFLADLGMPIVATWPNELLATDGDDWTSTFEFITPPSVALPSVVANAGFGFNRSGLSEFNSEKVYFRSEYGTGTLKADLFGDFFFGIQPATEHDQLYLRNSEAHLDSTLLRQLVAHDSLLALGQLAPHGRIVLLYEDGNHSGWRHLQERPEGGFMESYTGIDKQEWLAIDTVEFLPEIQGWNSIRNFDDFAYTVNVPSFIDFLLNQLPTETKDFRFRANWRATGPADLSRADGQMFRWHFFNWDMDNAYETDKQRALRDEVRLIGGFLPNFDRNLQFRFLFSDRAQCAYFDQGALAPQPMSERIWARTNQLLAYGRDSTDWATAMDEWWPLQVQKWLNIYEILGWMPEAKAAVILPQGTATQVGYQLALGNPNQGELFYFLDGRDPRQADGGLHPDALRYTQPVTLQAGQYQLIARSYDLSQEEIFERWSPACPVVFTTTETQGTGVAYPVWVPIIVYND